MKDRRNATPPRLALALAAALLAACGGELSGEGWVSRSGALPEVDETSPLARTFDEAAARYDVPADLLKAIAWVETGFDPALGEAEFDGQDGAYGLFALRGERLVQAAELSGYSVEQVQTDPDAQIFAAAALLDHHARTLGPSGEARDALDAWTDAVAAFSGLEADLALGYARDVMARLEAGGAIPLPDGTNLVLSRYEVRLPALPPVSREVQGLGAAGVVWRPSPNHSSRRGSQVELVVIHTCEGTYWGCVSWLRKSRARASAHYVVKEDGSEVTQLVDESRKAWHISAKYASSRNGGRLSHRNGQGTNTFSIGIEHAGYARQSSWPQAEIDRSVALVRDITARHQIPRDRYHIVGHGQLQPWNRTDPGANWPWAAYIAAIAGGGSGSGKADTGAVPTPVTVDNETPGRFSASAAWGYSAWASGRWGQNYRYRAPEATSDLAEWKVKLDVGGRYEVFTRVPGNGYSEGAPFIVHHRGGDTVVWRDLSQEGGKWVSLGTFDFDAGDTWRIAQSCWTNAPGYLIADAIRFVPR
ncbi:MAG: N-acetylmuramoyl-L-alanine amidase [Deltaproteobacteria bacterium]|nr:MAG: N-acetylmuramoyl-L-alanine amidase [Deltaproteobacteria bacterium]